MSGLNSPANRTVKYRWWHAFSWSKGFSAGWLKRSEEAADDKARYWAARDELMALLQERLSAHRPAQPALTFGDNPKVEFWCSTCRHRWPCADATALMRYGDWDHPDGYRLQLIADPASLPDNNRGGEQR